MAYRGNKTGKFEEIPSQLMSGCPDGYTKNANGDCVKITETLLDSGDTKVTTDTQTTTGNKPHDPNNPTAADTYHKVDKDRFPTLADYEEYVKDYWAPTTKDSSSSYIVKKEKENSSLKNFEEDIEKEIEEKPRFNTVGITGEELKKRVKEIPNKENTDSQRELNIAPVSRMRTFGRSKYGTPKPSPFLTSIFGMKTTRDKGVEAKYNKFVENRETDIEEGTKKRRGLTWKPLQKP